MEAANHFYIEEAFDKCHVCKKVAGFGDVKIGSCVLEEDNSFGVDCVNCLCDLVDSYC